MGYSTERQDIESRFATAWASTTPIAYQNVAFTPPATGSWVRLAILNGDAQQASLGSGQADTLYRQAGVISVSVFTNLNQGTNAARALADQAAAVFRGVDFGSGIKCRAPRIADVGVDGKFYQMDVSVPYYRDESF